MVFADKTARPGLSYGLRPEADLSLKPYCVPQGVITDSLDQSSTQRVGDDVAGEFFEVILIADRRIVVSALPYTGVVLGGFVDCDGASGFDLLHDAGKRTLLQLY